jgi:uncharacterized protein (TIGR02271 family)
LRKYVVEDQVTQTVPVRREEVRVEREPITDANVGAAMDGPEISEEEHEVVLHEEEPVVEKRVVPKERVRLDTESRTEEREISDTVRREEVDIDDGSRERRKPLKRASRLQAGARRHLTPEHLAAQAPPLGRSELGDRRTCAGSAG